MNQARREGMGILYGPSLDIGLNQLLSILLFLKVFGITEVSGICPGGIGPLCPYSSVRLIPLPKHALFSALKRFGVKHFFLEKL
jgi:hypothetical protein